MRMTLEADYAVRMVDCLAASNEKCCARILSDRTGVSLRFTLKILRKLRAAGLLISRRGVKGGYELRRKPEEISLRDVIETIDGPVAVSRCQIDHTCSRVGNPDLCAFYPAFSELSKTVSNELASVTFAKR